MLKQVHIFKLLVSDLKNIAKLYYGQVVDALGHLIASINNDFTLKRWKRKSAAEGASLVNNVE